ncbi:MAG TPA: hypothetical protein VMY37_35765 [Thermoguttaceae bacterium]|nr:hypothetical protein [Thermoguttaceae bacterium]
MSVISGKDGTLKLGDTEVTRVTQWKIEKTSGARAYTANDTGGAKKRVAGVKDCSGRFEIKAGDSDAVPVEEGDVVTLQLHVDDSGANYYEVPAIVDTIRAEVDISEGKTVAHVVAFSGNGPIVPHGILDKA